MGIRIPALLEAILEATAAKTDAEARIAGLRAVLDVEARRRYAEEGAAPSWKRRNLGAVRLDEPGAWAATVADPAAFGSYVAQHHPTEANGVVEVPADRLPEALEALGFLGIDVVDTRVEVRANFRTKYLEGLIVDVEETLDEDGSVDRTITVVDPATGAIVDGTSGQRSPAKLVVTLDRDLRAHVIEQANARANEVLDKVLDEAPTCSHCPPGCASCSPPDCECYTHQDEPDRRLEGREVTLEELTATGIVRPASALATPDTIENLPTHPTQGLAAGHRIPYVGEGADGARRSAQIDREEADGYGRDELPRILEVLTSAERWDAQAAELEADVVLEESPKQEAATLTPYADTLPVGPVGLRDREQDEAAAHVTPYTAKRAEEEAGVDAVEAMDNREALRRVARSKGIPAGGTKRDVAARLYAAGVRA